VRQRLAIHVGFIAGDRSGNPLPVLVLECKETELFELVLQIDSDACFARSRLGEADEHVAAADDIGHRVKSRWQG
jgi:hypothetical protein